MTPSGRRLHRCGPRHHAFRRAAREAVLLGEGTPEDLRSDRPKFALTSDSYLSPCTIDLPLPHVDGQREQHGDCGSKAGVPAVHGGHAVEPRGECRFAWCFGSAPKMQIRNRK